MKRFGLVVVLALFGFACAEGVGQMLEDAGDMLADAGQSMQDGSVSDAGAQLSDDEYPCELTHTFTTRDESYTRVDDYYGAEFSSPGLLGKLHIAWVCDRTYFGSATPTGHCPDGASCTGSQPTSDCYSTSASFDHDGRAYVRCGNRTRITYPDSPDYDSGAKGRYVRVVVGG